MSAGGPPKRGARLEGAPGERPTDLWSARRAKEQSAWIHQALPRRRRHTCTLPLLIREATVATVSSSLLVYALTTRTTSSSVVVYKVVIMGRPLISGGKGGCGTAVLQASRAPCALLRKTGRLGYRPRWLPVVDVPNEELGELIHFWTQKGREDFTNRIEPARKFSLQMIFFVGTTWRKEEKSREPIHKRQTFRAVSPCLLCFLFPPSFTSCWSGKTPPASSKRHQRTCLQKMKFAEQNR